jgi:hypothetical protein
MYCVKLRRVAAYCVLQAVTPNAIPTFCLYSLYQLVATDKSDRPTSEVRIISAKIFEDPFVEYDGSKASAAPAGGGVSSAAGSVIARGERCACFFDFQANRSTTFAPKQIQESLTPTPEGR